MNKQKTVNINGTRYDTVSGMPLNHQTETVAVAAIRHKNVVRPSTNLHANVQHSKTLKRSVLKKPVHKKITVEVHQSAPYQRSTSITKFASEPKAIANQRRILNDVGPTKHHLVTKTQRPEHTAPVASIQPPSAQTVKHHAISEALAKSTSSTTSKKTHRTGLPRGRIFNIASASLAVLLLAGYFTYLNLPNLSVRVAAAQAGIDASYPEYRPSGYRLDGPVAYSDGQVIIKFTANAGPQNFALNQSKSSWDSSALLANYVEPKSSGEYSTHNDAGLTIYAYDNNAAWINGGILYTITGDAPLSNEQVRHIATSM